MAPRPRLGQNERGTTHRTQLTNLAYTIMLDYYSVDCFDLDFVLAHHACIVWGTFIDDQGKPILVMVPTTSFFTLHAIDPNARTLWDSLCMEGYFSLDAWGPNIYHSTNFDYKVQEIKLDKNSVGQALGWHEGHIQYNEKYVKDVEWSLCSRVKTPTWDELLCQEIRLALKYTLHQVKQTLLTMQAHFYGICFKVANQTSQE